MKFGFIHNDNSTLSRAFADYFDSLKFTANATGDIDRQIKEFIENKIALSGVSVLFIKVALSTNYLEFLGLRLALHIRFSNKFPEIQTLPIILVSEESYEQLDRMVTFPGFLSSSGLYLSNENIDQVRKFINLLEDGSLKSCESVQELARKINIEPPASYQSHHSIANEWSILRWAKVLGIDDRTQFDEVRGSIENLLYYKYLQVKYPIEFDPEQAAAFIDNGQKVLLIDDEWNKGWKYVLNAIFNPSDRNQNKFETFEFDFKDQIEAQLINACKEKIKTFNPNILILDLRLIDKDFHRGINIAELSGIKILKVAKEINEGIRVIAFSASNKISSLLELQNAGVNGFILKEAPELNVSKNSTSELIKALAHTINEQSKYYFQKGLFEKCKKIQVLLTTQGADGDFEYNKLIKYLKAQLNIILSGLKAIDINRPTSIDITFLACYNFLESFKTYYVTEDKYYRISLGFDERQLIRYGFSNRLENKGEYVQNNRTDSPSWFHICAALFIDYFKVSASPYNEVRILKDLSEARNAYIHKNKTSFSISELELIIESMLLACTNIKE